MNNVQKEVYQYVMGWFQSASAEETARGLDAKTAAQGMGIWQNDTAAALNALCSQGKLRREGNRPIRYFPASEKESEEPEPAMTKKQPPAYENMIGADGSLRLQIQLAKAGASYPPNGVNMLIIGESGVGKSMMAEETWRYMNELREPGSPEKPFVIFNCAEYAENPQLLLSQLFGHEKGAYTGADTASAGLVEKANGGVLFLDEIHRLPATGQEMLFMLLDRGVYRRMGSGVDRHVQLMVIGATTENPNTSFLSTFRRRIPMIIEIPSLGERPVKERISLILHFLSEEANRISFPIRISPHALRLLVSYRSETNIGDLKNEIQLCCARGYLAYRNHLDRDNLLPYIEFSHDNLSRRLQECEVSSSVEEYISDWIKSHSLIVSPGNISSDTLYPSLSESDFYSFVESRLTAYAEEQRSSEEISQLVSLDVQGLFAASSSSTGTDQEMRIFDSVTASVMALSDELVWLASVEFNCVYPDIIRQTLAMYLQQIKFQAKANQASSAPDIHILSDVIEDKLRFVKDRFPLINQVLGVNLTNDEASIIALLLNTHEEEHPCRIGLIIMGHGRSTASSVAEFINSVLLTRIAHAVDIPIDLNTDEALEKLRRMVEKVDQGKGVIVLTDTDNFEFYEEKLRDYTGVYCRIIPGMSSVLALELCKSIITTDDDIDTISRHCIGNFRLYMDTVFQRALRMESVAPQPDIGRNVILICCITGTGSARRLKEYLMRFPSVYMNSEIIPIGLKDDIHEMAKRLGNRLKLVIGFINPQIKGVPFISMEKAASQEGINRVALILKGWRGTDLDLHWTQEYVPLYVRFRQISQRIGYFAPSIEADAAALQADCVVRSIGTFYPEPMQEDLMVRVYLHVITMFERLSGDQGYMPMPEDTGGLIDRDPALFRGITDCLTTACGELGLTFRESEAYYLLLALPERRSAGE